MLLIPKTSNLKPRQGFALIFVLLFATIALMVGTSIVVALISGMKLNRQAHQGAEAYYLARGGIDAAVNKLRESSDKDPQWPTSGCSKFTIYHYTGTGYDYLSGEKSMADVVTWVEGNSSARKDGSFAVRLCSSSNEIESIGFFQSRKITLKAVVKKNPSTTPKLVKYYFDKQVCNDALCLNPTTVEDNDTCKIGPFTNASVDDCGGTDYGSRKQIKDEIKYDHYNDLIKIYQAGS